MYSGVREWWSLVPFPFLNSLEMEECVLVLNYWVNYDELCNFVRFLALRNLDVRI